MIMRWCDSAMATMRLCDGDSIIWLSHCRHRTINRVIALLPSHHRNFVIALSQHLHRVIKLSHCSPLYYNVSWPWILSESNNNMSWYNDKWQTNQPNDLKCHCDLYDLGLSILKLLLLVCLPTDRPTEMCKAIFEGGINIFIMKTETIIGLHCHCDLDLWHRNPKFSRGHLIVMDKPPYQVRRFMAYKFLSYGCLRTDRHEQSNIPPLLWSGA